VRRHLLDAEIDPTMLRRTDRPPTITTARLNRTQCAARIASTTCFVAAVGMIACSLWYSDWGEGAGYASPLAALGAGALLASAARFRNDCSPAQRGRDGQARS
jgi:hypothetical protein